MRIKVKDGQLQITTNAYQAKNGAVFLSWGNTVIKLEKDQVPFAYDIPDFDKESFNNYYTNPPRVIK